MLRSLSRGHKTETALQARVHYDTLIRYTHTKNKNKIKQAERGEMILEKDGFKVPNYCQKYDL